MGAAAIITCTRALLNDIRPICRLAAVANTRGGGSFRENKIEAGYAADGLQGLSCNLASDSTGGEASMYQNVSPTRQRLQCLRVEEKVPMRTILLCNLMKPGIPSAYMTVMVLHGSRRRRMAESSGRFGHVRTEGDVY